MKAIAVSLVDSWAPSSHVQTVFHYRVDVKTLVSIVSQGTARVRNHTHVLSKHEASSDVGRRRVYRGGGMTGGGRSRHYGGK